MSSVGYDSLVEGRYQLLEVIGEGGMATVYRAFDQRLRRTLAIKVLAPALSNRRSIRERFLGEARAMASLHDRRVVRVIDYGEDGERAYIIMELVDGGSLLDRVRDHGPLPPRMAAMVSLELCRVLDQAHEQGIIHRDIKPHNVLLTRHGEIRVTDFGVAQVRDQEGEAMTRTGAVMGTWGFMAPEQKSNAKHVDGRADVYSVGATLWALLRGETPPELFMADSETEMLEGIPDELAEIVRRATRYRKDERYRTCREMGDSIGALLSLLPEDPDGSIPLVPPPPERQGMDLHVPTMAQFATEPPPTSPPVRPRGGEPLGTLIPTVAPVAAAVVEEDSDISEPDVGAGRTTFPSPRDDFEDPFAEPVAPPPEAPPWRRWALLVGLAVVAGGLVGGLLLFLLPDVGAPVEVAPTTPDAAVPSAPTAPIPAAATPAPPIPAAPALSPAAPAVATPRKDPASARGRPAPATAASPPTADIATPAPTLRLEPVPTERAEPAPQLRHTPPAPAPVGGRLSFVATTAPDCEVRLYWRAAGSAPFQESRMNGADGRYTTALSVEANMAAGIEYFIEASCGGVKQYAGRYNAPLRVAPS